MFTFSAHLWQKCQILPEKSRCGCRFLF
uniref:Uncharacterized protein n=1 Tax=Anguilla anguilla TaxID=7936 RepID=A0A0E9VJS2_ANGAN